MLQLNLAQGELAVLLLVAHLCSVYDQLYLGAQDVPDVIDVAVAQRVLEPDDDVS